MTDMNTNDTNNTDEKSGSTQPPTQPSDAPSTREGFLIQPSSTEHARKRPYTEKIGTNGTIVEHK